MLPLRGRALLVQTSARAFAAVRASHSGRPPRPPLPPPAENRRPPPSSDATATANASAAPLTGAAKLFADAADEDKVLLERRRSGHDRDHLVAEQGPIWTGDESMPDSVLRMLMDAHKPHRTGEGVKHDSADMRIKNWMHNLDMAPREDVIKQKGNIELRSDGEGRHRTKIPPHLHRPWHATYTGDDDASAATPKIKQGSFTQRNTPGAQLFSDLELRLPKLTDGTQRQKAREMKRSLQLQNRLDGAREHALDYHLGVKDGEVTQQVGSEQEMDIDDGEQTFRGNRQVRGFSALGAQRGAASGMRAWGGLVEDRIKNSIDAGHFVNLKGRGAPITQDPALRIPHLETTEVFMNRIIKNQGALPPWIELQNQVSSSVDSFRSMLLDSYTRHLVRAVLTKYGINPLPPQRAIADHDPAWEAKEHKFHEASVKSINDLIYKMNAQAPMPSRRGKMMLESELNRIRGDVLRNSVWAGLLQRAEDAKADRSKTHSFLTTDAGKGRFSTGNSAGAGGVGAGSGSGGGGLFDAGSVGGASMPSPDQHSGGGLGFLVFAGVGLGLVVYLRRSTVEAETFDSSLIPYIPVHEEDPEHEQTFLASSPQEQHYTVIEFLRSYIVEPFLTLVRFLHLALLFGPVIITSPMLYVGSTPRRRQGKPITEQEDNWGAVWWYGFLVDQMQRAGPSFIKLGQWAASRTDLFPAALCEKMSKLHSNNDPHPFKYTKRVIEESFGVKFDDIFEEFNETPIGCGAIAQVYKAKLRPAVWSHSDAEQKALAEEVFITTNGDQRLVTTVAVKVLHPRVEKLVRRDIAIMSIFANIINAFPGMEWISLPDEVKVFGDMMNQQLDLRVEASNLERFDRNFKNRSKVITFPQPITVGDGHTAASREVLIEEFEDALPLKYFLRNGGGPYDGKIANFGLDAFLEMLLLDNWTHGDLHPGNIMVRFIKPGTHHIIRPFLNRFNGTAPPQESPIPMESISAVEIVHELEGLADDKDAWLTRLDELNEQGYAPQLVFIDAGLVTSLNEKNRRDFLDLFQAVAEFDGYRAGKLMVERCRRPDLAFDEETFALKIQHLVLSVKSKTFSLAKIKISDILGDVLVAVRQHHVKLEGDFVNTVLSILLLEGIGRQLDPNMDLFKSALPILRQLGRQMGTRDAISHVPSGNMWAMVKLWAWAEARSVAGEVSTIDKWIKYDWLSPDI